MIRQLNHLGFTAAQARNAVDFLSQPSPFVSNLLASLSPLESSIEYLVLHIPECDLPERFLPSNNSSNPFITSAHSGADNLKKRWIEDKAVKEAGWPPHAVKECTANPKFVEDWGLLMVGLGRKLIGKDLDGAVESSLDTHEPYGIDEDEATALGAFFPDPTHLAMPLFSAPIQLHVLIDANRGYPRPAYAPMYITSPSVPAYIRLHLLSQLLREMGADDFIYSGEGFCMATMRILEGEWANIEDNGPPDMSKVLENLAPRLQAPRPAINIPGLESPANNQGRRQGGPRRRDGRDNTQIKQDFEALCRSDKVRGIPCRLGPMN